MDQLSEDETVLVQEYIEPHLIHNRKYHMRIHALVTSIEPLRIYLYNEGSVKIAPKEYSPDNLDDISKHVSELGKDGKTNNEHDWLLEEYWAYMSTKGIDMNSQLGKIKDLVIKTMIMGEKYFNTQLGRSVTSHYSRYQLFGFDIMMDKDLNPWLLEVEPNPTTFAKGERGEDVATNMLTETLNLARIHLPENLSEDMQKNIAETFKIVDEKAITFDPRLYELELNKNDRIKHRVFLKDADNRGYLNTILDMLTPGDVRILISAEDELEIANNFERIYPTDKTFSYNKYFDEMRYYNMLMDAWETRFGSDRGTGVEILKYLASMNNHLSVEGENEV